jgi:TatD DNase family protein
MYFDTHAHYDDAAFDPDRDELLLSLGEEGVELVVDPGCDVESTLAAADLAARYPFIYSAAGIHPEELGKLRPDSLERIRGAAMEKKTVAIGEIGLDYYWDSSRRDEQKELFAVQLEMALELDMPVIVHDREAHGDSLEMVCSYTGLRGVFHCFSGSAETASELLRRGWYLGFDGPITYKNARKQLAVLEICPPERILIETDSPYMPPVPHRGERNDSRMLRYISEKVAQVKGMTPEAAAALTLENGKRLFGIGDRA